MKKRLEQRPCFDFGPLYCLGNSMCAKAHYKYVNKNKMISGAGLKKRDSNKGTSERK